MPDAPHADDDRTDDRANERRDFLKKAGIGTAAAGALWMAPAITSMDAAYAVGTCGSGTTTFAWSTGGNLTRYTSGKVGTTTTAGIDIRITGVAQQQLNQSGLSSGTYNWCTRSGAGYSCNGTPDWPSGDYSSFYGLQMFGPNSTGTPNCQTAGPSTRFSEVTFGFFDQNTTTPHAVRNLQFRLLDVDQGDYTDVVSVYLNGSPTVATTTGATPDFTTVTRGPDTPFRVNQTAGVATFTGTGSTAATDSNSNVFLATRAALDIYTVRVRFSNSGGNPGTVQWVGIGDLEFCKV